MSEKPLTQKTIRRFVGDSMSTANFQGIRAPAKAGGKPAGTEQQEDGWVSRAGGMSSSNFQGHASKGKHDAQPASQKPVAPAPIKAPARPPKR